MQRRFFFGALFAFGLLSLAPSFAHAAQLKQSLEVGGWIPYWRADQGVADVEPHISDFTAIYPFGYTVSSEGVLYDAMGIADDPWKTLVAQAKADHVRVIPTVMWSDGQQIYDTLSNSTTRIALEDQIAALATREGFDGIDIDFENKTAETKPYFSLFLKGLYSRMGQKWVYCTIESRTPLDSRYTGTPPADASVYANDFTQINKYCDRVQIMAYDQGTIDQKLNAAANSAPYAPVADPAWVTKVVQVAEQSISKKKIILGIPTYGYEYQVTPLSQQGFSYDIQWSFDPTYALQLAASYGITPMRNTAGELSFSYLPSSTPAVAGVPTAAAVGPAVSTSTQTFNLLWWDDAVSVAQKIALAKQLGLRGVAIFKLDGGEDSRIWSVLD
ncbi:MAG TPA: glycosyl hydrolase family 18 protein [Candidatus Paceibacterota bacterium]|nr:glycosyl hydrolase family 18 protein [Candidatus Paceibacterota bacterium]